MGKVELVDAYSFFDDLMDDELKKQMQYDEMLVGIACEFINYRTRHGITQKELAEKLQMTQAMISKLESGEYNPTIKMLFEIAHKLSWKFNVQFKSEVEVNKYIPADENVKLTNDYFDQSMGWAS